MEKLITKRFPRTRWSLVATWVMLAGVAPAYGATYYVRKSGSDANSGTSAADALLTISKAEDLAAAGDTIYVGAGAYQEEVKIEKSGSAGAYISFVADSKGTYTGDAGDVIVSGSGTRDRVFKIEHHRSYIRIQGFRVTGARREGMKIKDALFLTIQDCRVYGNEKGIEMKGEDCLISGCYVYNNAKRGIKCDGRGSGSIVSGCVIYGNGDEGLEVKDILLDGDGDDDSHDDDQADEGTDVVANVFNCVVYGNGKEGIKVGGRKSANVTLANNTVVGNAKEGIKVKKDATVIVKSSIIAYNGKDGIKSDHGNATVTSDYNLFWQNTGGDYGGVVAGANDLSADPLFKDVATNKYRLTAASPAINGCPGAGAPSVDWEGQTRRASDGLVDIGADEFGKLIRLAKWREVSR